MKALCKVWGCSGDPSPSTVVTSLPAAVESGRSQDATARPSTRTLQAPHWLKPQPKRVPMSPSGPRSAESNGASGSASTTLSAPFRRSRTPGIALLHLGAGELHHLRPFLDVVAQVFAELGRRHLQRHGALPCPVVAHLGSAQHLADLGVELVDDRLRRAGRRHEAEPDRRLVAGDAGLGDRRHVGQDARARQPGDAERPHLPGLDVRRHRGDGVDHHLHMAADDAVARLAAAAVRHVDDVGAAHRFEQLAGHMVGRAGAGGGVVERARPRLRVGHEFLQVLRRHRGMDEEHEVGIVDRRHRHEIAHQLVGLLRDQRLVRGVGVRHHEQRVPVRRRLRGLVGADDGAGARPVLDHERPLERFAEILADEAGVDVGGSAGAERHDDLDIPARVVLSDGGRREPGGAGEDERELHECRQLQALRSPGDVRAKRRVIQPAGAATKGERMTDLDDYRAWLQSLPRRGAYHALSPQRPYETAEEGYDRDAAPSLYAGELLTGMLSAVAPGPTGLCLEIGCGTGYLTCGLVAAGRFERYLVTDGSERFLDLTRGKLARIGRLETVDFAVFNGDDLGEIAFDRFALIALRSVLHHIADYRGFFAGLARRLKPGGVIAMLEPRAEFFLMTATLLGFLPALAEKDGAPLSAAELGHVRLFDATTRFYLDRTSDKTGAEDRYAFTTEELAELASENGLSFHRMDAEGKTGYGDDLVSYLAYCMSFPDELMAKVKRLLAQSARGIDETLKDLSPINASEWLLFRRA